MYLAAAEVTAVRDLPDGMVAKALPESEYAIWDIRNGEEGSVNPWAWLAGSEYQFRWDPDMAMLGDLEMFWLDPADPRNTGLLLAPNITLLQDNLEAPESLQASLGISHRLGRSGPTTITAHRRTVPCDRSENESLTHALTRYFLAWQPAKAHVPPGRSDFSTTATRNPFSFKSNAAV